VVWETVIYSIGEHISMLQFRGQNIHYKRYPEVLHISEGWNNMNYSETSIYHFQMYHFPGSSVQFPQPDTGSFAIAILSQLLFSHTHRSYPGP
jgi:hypothetical protein